MTQILLVEDDQSLCEAIAEQLEEEHFLVHPAHSLADARSFLASKICDLAIIDVNLPDGDGFELARNLSANTPSIFLTAMNSAEFRLEAYELGAADFIPKPFHFRELLLRIKNVMQNAGLREQIRFEGFSVLPEERKLVFDTGKERLLAENDFRLLQFLLREAPRPVSREEILDKAWSRERPGNARSIDNAVVRLRDALGEDGKSAICSVRGIGYCWKAAERL